MSMTKDEEMKQRQAIGKAGRQPPAPETAHEGERQVEILLTHDYWPLGMENAPEEDRRVMAGTVISVPVSEAMRLLEHDKAERADPLGV